MQISIWKHLPLRLHLGLQFAKKQRRNSSDPLGSGAGIWDMGLNCENLRFFTRFRTMQTTAEFSKQCKHLELSKTKKTNKSSDPLRSSSRIWDMGPNFVLNSRFFTLFPTKPTPRVVQNKNSLHPFNLNLLFSFPEVLHCLHLPMSGLCARDSGFKRTSVGHM